MAYRRRKDEYDSKQSDTCQKPKFILKEKSKSITCSYNKGKVLIGSTILLKHKETNSK